MATTIEIKRESLRDMADFYTISNENSSSTSSIVDQDLLSKLKSEDSAVIDFDNVGKATSGEEVQPISSAAKSECSDSEAGNASRVCDDVVEAGCGLSETTVESKAAVIGEKNLLNISKSDVSTLVFSAQDKNSSFNSDDASGDYSQCESDAFGLPAELLEEERKMAVETEKEFDKLSQTRASVNKEEKERRYKTLMTLLGKSNHYAKYMSEKLQREKEKNVLMEKQLSSPSSNVLKNSTNKRKSTALTNALVSPGEQQPATKKQKTNELGESVGYDPETQYRNENGLVVSKRQPKLLTGAIMRSYQLEGLEWLVALYKNAVNGILADEMGLGKTIQVISLLCHLREKNIFGPHLIIAPLSTLPNWLFEFANFAPDVPVVLFHGNAEKRIEVRNRFLNIFRSKDRRELPVVVTSYEMPLYDRNFLSLVKWCYIIVDEGHRLKNCNSLLGIELRKYRTESRLLLTGTPLQNNIAELWSLLNFLVPEIFDDLPAFENVFDFSDLSDVHSHDQLIAKEKEERIISNMHQILEPFLLRRLKADVNIHLPRKKEILVYAPLTAEQETLYKSTLDQHSLLAMASRVDGAFVPGTKRRCRQKIISYSEDWGIDENTEYVPLRHQLQKAKERVVVREGDVEYLFNIKLQNPSMMCRKIVNHPYLVKTPVYPGTRDIVIDEKMIERCGKLLVLDALLPRLKADGHKVLLFSTFVVLLDMIEDYMIMRGYKYVRLDGNCKIENRLETIKQFNSDAETFIFLISTRAGGLGINLTSADTVIIYNSDWNPQVDLQAQDRCHRIGQTRPVIVYRLVTAGTIDERIVNCATAKRRLEKVVVKKGKFQQQMSKEEIDINELQELLKSTDYKQVIHPNGLVLSDQQIEVLLDRSDLLYDDEEAAATRKSSSKSTKTAKSTKATCENAS